MRSSSGCGAGSREDSRTSRVEESGKLSSTSTSKKDLSMSSLWQKLRERWKITVPVSVVALTGIGLAIAWGVGAFDAPEEPVKIAEPAVVEPVEEPEPEPEPEEAPEEAPQVSVDSVNHMPYSEVWNPPDQGEGFWQVVDPDHGYYEEGGTKYVLAHACEVQVCAGDEFLKLSEGDSFEYLSETYRIDNKYSIHKDEIADQPIWDNVPGRVVIVTCIIDGRWQDSDHNEIFVASPAG